MNYKYECKAAFSLGVDVKHLADCRMFVKNYVPRSLTVHCYRAPDAQTFTPEDLAFFQMDLKETV